MNAPRFLALLCILPLLAGCAGGWRGGAVPAEWADTGGSAVAAAAPAAAPAAKATNAKATHATASGAVFVWAGEGNSVAVAGEFNSWNTSADPMQKQGDGTWSLTKTLPAGKYQYKFVVDGSNWKPDPDAPETADDGYGGKNSVVVVGGTGTAAAPAAAAPAAKPAAATATGTGPAVTANGVVFKYTGGGNTVNLAGEFNSWSTSADPMQKQADGSFTLTKSLPAGKYQYKFVVDGGTWKEDPNAKEFADDGYGGKNAVVVVGEGAAAAPAAAAAAPAAKPAATGTAPAVTANGVVFKYTGGGNTVNLAGEFNSWSTSADPMQKQADGSFTLTKSLPAGKYQYKFVVDGGTWKEDPNAKEFVDDGYGGKNSLVVVGDGAAAAAPAAAAAAAAPAGAIKPLAAGAHPTPPQPTANGVVFTYAGPAKTGVALCGDFNNWATTADPMTQQPDGTWTVTRKLAAGTYGYKFLVDGSNWKQDEGNPQAKDDGFGGKNSVVTVK